MNKIFGNLAHITMIVIIIFFSISFYSETKLVMTQGNGTKFAMEMQEKVQTFVL